MMPICERITKEKPFSEETQLVEELDKSIIPASRRPAIQLDSLR